MSERKALTLALLAVVAVTTAACGLVMALGGGGDLLAVTMVLVGGLGVDQLSKLVMSFEKPEQR